MLFKTIELDLSYVNRDDLASCVVVIRALRMLTNMNLKDARDLIAQGGVTQLQIKVEDMVHADGRRDSAQTILDQASDLLRSAGVRLMFGPDIDLLKVIKEVSVTALGRGNLHLADSLLTVLKKFS